MSLSTKLWTLFTLALLTTLSIILLRLPASTLNLITYTFLTLLTLASGITGLFYTLLAYEFYLTKRTSRQQAQLMVRRERYQVIQDGFGMVHLLNHQTDIIENLTIYPGTHHNGHWEEPHPAAAAAWHALMGKRGSESPTQHLLLASTQQPIDLLKVMTQPGQSYAIIGGQQQGKTYQARLIAQYWQQQGLEVVVIGPKQDKGEWAGCTFYGASFTWEHVAEGINRVREEALRRHQSKLGHKQHDIMPVFFDDWTNTRAQLSEVAEQLILDATTLYASVNMIMYFILHLDTANAWGVGKIGAALKENFIKLRIKPTYESGIIVKGKTTGLLVFPGDKEKREVALLGGSLSAIKPDLILQPTKEEDHLLRLVEQGITSKKQLSESIWGKGKFGKYYNDKIDGILGKYGLE